MFFVCALNQNTFIFIELKIIGFTLKELRRKARKQKERKKNMKRMKSNEKG